MTGRDIIARAKKYFPILYGADTADAFDHLMIQALGTFQDRAGWIEKTTTPADSGVVDIPDHFSGLVTVEDAVKQFHEAVVDHTEEVITVIETGISIRPYTIHYMVDLRSYDLTTEHVPDQLIGVLTDYLVALIDVGNTARARRVALATGQAIEVRSDDELIANKKAVEDAMEEMMAIIPSVMVW